VRRVQPLKIGFTGTQAGMTYAQRGTVGRLLLERMPLGEFHHGDCVGADAEAHDFALMAGASIHVHPCDITDKRAWKIAGVDWVGVVKPPLQRNRDIVRAVDIMVCAPRMFIEELRSGTWSAIRFARKQRVPLLIVWPDGSVTESPPLSG